MTEGEMMRLSGYVESKDPMVAFLYTLMKDELTPGTVEEIVTGIEKEGVDAYSYSNGWLAKYAIHLAERLRNSMGNRIEEE